MTGGAGGAGERPRDWDKELAEIDRLLAKTPQGAAAAPPKPAVQPKGGALPAARGGASKREVWGTWGRVLLGTLLAVGVTQWPYPHRCGVGLVLYLGVVGVVVLAGFWSAVVSWRRRIALAHIMSLAVIVAGLGIAAATILPRIGYARQALTWVCP
jgi:hypothetical protein